MNNRLFLALLLLGCILMAGCEVENITGPEPVSTEAPTTDPASPASCTKPTATAVVNPAVGALSADYSDNTRDIKFRSWTFPGGSPPTSDQRAGSVTFSQPGSYQWTLRVCRETASDPEDCCDSVGGTISISTE